MPVVTDQPTISEFLGEHVEPPQDLIDAAASVNPDPDPVEPGQELNGNKPKFIITTEVKNTVRGRLNLAGELLSAPLEAIDPYCGPVFANNVGNMINAYLPIICRSPGAVRYILMLDGGFLDWINALRASWPVIQAVYAHHLGRTVVKDADTEEYVRRAKTGDVNHVSDTLSYSAG
jgi:hypothetical protein